MFRVLCPVSALGVSSDRRPAGWLAGFQLETKSVCLSMLEPESRLDTRPDESIPNAHGWELLSRYPCPFSNERSKEELFSPRAL